ncbi:MAG: GH116 family glycosyl-hydrolase [Chitinophagaceae bacterium]
MIFKNIQRRSFLKQSAILSASFAALRLPVIAGPFAAGELDGTQIPENKKLDPAWVRSLYKRGAPTTYLKSRNELSYIGMPVGGINCGTLYLGGDGRLWLWDIFNKNQEGIQPAEIPWDTEVHAGKKIRPRDGSAYVQPAKDIRPLEQGILLKIEHEGKTYRKQLRQEDWDEISFEATYPLATIRYSDKVLPLEISLEVFSPFIPLDEFNSGLPATILSLNIKNKSDQIINIEVTAFLENKTAIYSAKENEHHRVNTASGTEGIKALHLTVEGSSATDVISQASDYGSMCIACIAKDAVIDTKFEGATNIKSLPDIKETITRKPAGEKLLGSVSVTHQLKPGKFVISDFVICWYFPNLSFKGLNDKGRYYSNQFKNALQVYVYIQQHFKKLTSGTRLFKNTWYDSTLPHWFLERTISNVSTLATTTCHRLASGRFYAWEGVGCCAGTCTHVWHYAQAVGRIFPSLERDTRSRVDLGLALQPEGGIIFRAEFEKRPAIDGQAGTILRIYREHQMSADHTFLESNWTNIKKAIQFLINQDRNKDGMEDTPMENTLDAVWDGEIAWIVGLCIAAVSAGKLMAMEMQDAEFEKICEAYVMKGKSSMETKLFNGEYFIHRPDAEKGRVKLGSYNTCHIDQVLGQSWAFQVGLERIISREKSLSALRSLWKYNFTPDVGPYIKTHPGGRPYALAGEGGMIMNTNPKNEAKAYGDNVTWQLGYFHECMSGFEHQVASHMMAEGMTDEALVLTRMIHDRYHAAKRNPFNEIECSDHYARAMASYGTFITACGFQYHGPNAYIRFAPAWDAVDFKAPFITAQGWGTYTQKKNDNSDVHAITLKSGSLQVKTVGFDRANEQKVVKVTVTLSGKPLAINFDQVGKSVSIILVNKINIRWNQSLIVVIKS